MTNVASLAGIASLIGDPARAVILVTLMDGRALTAGELGTAAGVAPSTASGHLGRMLDAGLLALERQGRHRYYRIASPSVAGLVESLMSLSGELTAAAARGKPISTGPRDQALRRSRLCYDHLAGEVAVGIADRDLLPSLAGLERASAAHRGPGRAGPVRRLRPAHVGASIRHQQGGVDHAARGRSAEPILRHRGRLMGHVRVDLGWRSCRALLLNIALQR